MAMKAGRVGVSPQDVDSRGHITAGGITPEQKAKLDRALLIPVSSLTEKEIAGVGTGKEQIMFKIGNGLSIAGDTSPYTLSVSGGLPKIHCIHLKAGTGTAAINITFTIFNEKSEAFTWSDVVNFLNTNGFNDSSDNKLYMCSGSHFGIKAIDTTRIKFITSSGSSVNYDSGTIYDTII